MKSELEMKDGIVNALIAERSQAQLNNNLSSLQESVRVQFNIVDSLIKEEEKNLHSLIRDKSSCIKEIESLFHWLKNLINEFPDAKKDSLESNLSISQNIVALLKENDACLGSIIEKAHDIAVYLPDEEKIFLEAKAKEVTSYFKEIQKQAECHVRDLCEKLDEKREVNRT